ncbi:transcription termination/antitermination protein NusG [Afipia sp. TerB]
MPEQYWAACQTITGREHVVRAEIERMERGAFLPTMVRSWVSDGKLSVAERAAVPGYVFFRAQPDDWSPVQDIDGVIGVLANGDRAMRVSPDDMARLLIGHATGAHNRFEARLSSGGRRDRKKYRRPRPSKRARFK